jgi:hypothetical protein
MGYSDKSPWLKPLEPGVVCRLEAGMLERGPFDPLREQAGPQEGIVYDWQRRQVTGANISAADLQILRMQLLEAIKGQEKAEAELVQIKRDIEAKHESGFGFRCDDDDCSCHDTPLIPMIDFHGVTYTVEPVNLRAILELLDAARNWVQDDELRARITAVCPPKPRTT